MISEARLFSAPIFSAAPRSSYTGITVRQGTPVLREVVARMNGGICSTSLACRRWWNKIK